MTLINAHPPLTGGGDDPVAVCHYSARYTRHRVGLSTSRSAQHHQTQASSGTSIVSLVPTPTEDGPGIDCLRMRQPLVRF